MKQLKNWDNKTWLSSNRYILSFCKFLKKKIRINKKTSILDIGCGRANIISFLQKKYKFQNKPIGIDIVKNKNTKKNIIFKKTEAIKYLKKTDKKFDLILIKQTIHFFSKNRLDCFIDLAKEKLNNRGQILIFSLKTKNNKIPCFKKMRENLEKSLKRDEVLFKIIKKNLKEIIYTNFNFKVNISKQKYVRMIRERYISCLLNMSNKEIELGISEIESKYKNQIKFTDTLKCISYRK